MYKYLTVEEYLADRQQPLRSTGEALLAVVEAALPEASASMAHGNPTWKLGGAPVCVVKAYTRHLTLTFTRGARFGDPSGRLVPSGTQQAAGVKLRTPQDVDDALVTGWLRQAHDFEVAART